VSFPAPEPLAPDPVPAERHLRPVTSHARPPAGESRRAGSERRPLGMPLVAALVGFVLPGMGHAFGEAFLRGAFWLLSWWLVAGVTSEGQLSAVVLGVRALAALDAFFLTRLLLVRRRRPLGRGRVAR